APLANWANAQAWFRAILHRLAGIHRDRRLPKFQEETFPHWFERTRDDRHPADIVGVRGAPLPERPVGVGGASAGPSPALVGVGGAPLAGPPPTLKVVLFST